MNLTSAAYRTYWRLEQRVAPGVRFAQLDYEDSVAEAVQPGCDWLDIGCGHQLFYPWRRDREREVTSRARCVTGVDPEHGALVQHPTIRGSCASADALPFRDASFDLVTANMVVEHLPNPAQTFAEIARVLRPNGRFLFHTPNANGYPTLMARAVPDAVRGVAAWLLEKRESVDRFPTFYRANTEPAIRRVASRAGLRVEYVHHVRTTAMLWFVAPVALMELAWLRFLNRPAMSSFRPNLIAQLVRS